MAASWDPGLYQASHSFVWRCGRELLELLGPQPGERVLDVGCGTGQLTAEIARAGAAVTGIDSSQEMIAEARRNFPELKFELADVRALPYVEEFDAAFSNAALHWVRKAEPAAAAMARALRRGGRFVVELGGRGNVRLLLDAAFRALEELGVSRPEQYQPWFFPSVAEYAGILERQGLEVTYATLFDRETELEGGARGLADWVTMFGSSLSGVLEKCRREEFVRLVEQYAAPHLLRDGTWHADYRRLRIKAVKPL